MGTGIKWSERESDGPYPPSVYVYVELVEFFHRAPTYPLLEVAMFGILACNERTYPAEFCCGVV